jgi:hypothetical protein
MSLDEKPVSERVLGSANPERRHRLNLRLRAEFIAGSGAE